MTRGNFGQKLAKFDFVATRYAHNQIYAVPANQFSPSASTTLLTNVL